MTKEEATKLVGKKKLTKVESVIYHMYGDDQRYELYKDMNGNLAARLKK